MPVLSDSIIASGSPGTSLLNSGTPLFPPVFARKKRCTSIPWPTRTLRGPREGLLASGPFPCPTAPAAPAATIETSFCRLPPPSGAYFLAANHLRPVLIERTFLQQSGLSLADHLLFAILGHEKSARIYLRACRFDRAHLVSSYDLIRRLASRTVGARRKEAPAYRLSVAPLPPWGPPTTKAFPSLSTRITVGGCMRTYIANPSEPIASMPKIIARSMARFA